MKRIRADILQKDGEPRKFQGSGAFMIPLFFSCRNVNCRTIIRLVKLTFREIAQKLIEEELVEESIGQMKILLLIDGLDELTDDSKALIEEGVVPFLKNHAGTTCIFASRPHSVQAFQAKLQHEGLFFKTLKIEELKTKAEQIDFLNTASVWGSDISVSYENSNFDLRIPVLLRLYIFLHNLDSNSVKLLPTSSHLMREAIEYGLRDASNRLNQSGIKDCEIVATIILQKITFLSFCCLLLDKLLLKQQEIKWLKAECRKEYSGINVNTIDLISCFLPAIASDTLATVSDDVDFFHKSHQETLASIYVCQQMIDTGRSFEEIFLEVAREYKNIKTKYKERKFDACAFLKQ